MSFSVSRLVGAALIVAGIAVSLWLALGVPQEWTGGMRWAGGALRLTSLGVIALGACLVYPDRATDTTDDAPASADADASHAAAPEGPDGSRV
ncbi:MULTISPECIES: hypothetical protein [Streptomyces]|uniref:Uncharacterized protein n=1 Tax=Streptomyces scabiei TaxID=1930 RepID=A0A117ECI9_STRSC|nr:MULTISPECIES: hypothetical protein [Streptomyces]MDX3069524.1 hypothetical protein [Streptomyces sp. ND04-05B]GAQ61013.1 hypothetical protein SsS58_01356 [Streptomyces scabiei]